MSVQAMLPDGSYDAIGFESISVGSGAAVGFTLATAGEARAAFCTLEGTVTMRYRVDGTAPTSSEGHQTVTPSATAPVSFYILGRNNIVKFKAITSASTATLKVTYLR